MTVAVAAAPRSFTACPVFAKQAIRVTWLATTVLTPECAEESRAQTAVRLVCEAKLGSGAAGLIKQRRPARGCASFAR